MDVRIGVLVWGSGGGAVWERVYSRTCEHLFFETDPYTLLYITLNYHVRQLKLVSNLV